MARNTDIQFQLNGNWYYLLKRPGLDLFLDFAIKNFRVGIWTAADKNYAIEVCKKILTYEQVTRVEFIYSRNYCFLDRSTGVPMFTKPLKKIYANHPEFNEENTLMIDNTAHVMKFNSHNAVHVPDFTTDRNDQILFHLRNIIIQYYQRFPPSNSVKHLVQVLKQNLDLIKQKKLT